MTREEAMVRMENNKARLDELVRAYNAATQEKRFEDALRIDKDIDTVVGEYAVDAQHAEFERCRESENPMMTAICLLDYTVLAVKDEPIENSELTERKVVEKKKMIDLAKLHKYCKGIGADEKWLNYAEKMNFLLTAQKAIDLGIDPKEINDSYAMADISRDLDMGKTPTSNTNLLRTLNMCVQAMIGDGFSATSHDVKYLLSIYSKHGKKALTVSCSNHAKFRSYLAEICHRIVLDKHYEVEYKAKKA
jgi:hypothetical protein